METLNRLPFRARKSVFDKLEKIVDISALSKDEREKYDESIKVYRDNLAVLAFAKQEGSDERALSIARKFKQMGMELVQISEGTGLPIETIENL